jgi:hypothetical protein
MTNALLICDVCKAPVQHWTTTLGPAGLAFTLRCHGVMTQGTIAHRAGFDEQRARGGMAGWVRTILLERLAHATQQAHPEAV